VVVPFSDCGPVKGPRQPRRRREVLIEKPS
jgi:hypothetical protein